MDFNEVIKKWNYSPELADILFKVYNEHIKQFGKEAEPVIFEAYMNTPVVMGNPYDVSVKYGTYDEEDTLVTAGDLKRASGVYSAAPVLSYDGEFKVEKVNRVVAIGMYDLTQDSTKGVIAHELSHMVKGYIQEYEISDNVLITRSGLIESRYELSYEGGKVKKKLVNELYVGLEEGLNTEMEYQIMNSILDHPYSSSGYGVIHQLAKNFMDKPEVWDIFKKASFYKEYDELNEFFNRGDKNLLPEFGIVLDHTYELGLRQYANLFNKEEMLKISEEMKNYLNEVYWPLYDEFMGREETLDAGDR